MSVFWRSTHVEKVITGHTRLTGDTGGDDDNVGVLERLSETTVSGKVAGHDRGGVDVREIGSDTGGVDAMEREHGERPRNVVSIHGLPSSP